MVGQIATFIKTLQLSYDEVVDKIPYRILLLMQKDVMHESSGDIIEQVSAREKLKQKNNG